MDERIEGNRAWAFLAEHGQGRFGTGKAPAGKLRWARRVKMLCDHLGQDDGARLGCGTGYFTRELARSGADIIAVDISPELPGIAKARCSATNVRSIQNACALSYSDAVFDSVVGSSVLHHLEIKEALREIYRVLQFRGTDLLHRAKHAEPANRDPKECSVGKAEAWRFA